MQFVSSAKRDLASRAGAVVCALLAGAYLDFSARADAPVSRALGDLQLRATPDIFCINQLGAEIDTAAVTDVVAGKFTGDHLIDLAVAWYATDLSSPATRQRYLTIFETTPDGSLTRRHDFNLYIYNSAADSLSVFRNGTSEIGVGDFDGDGDADLAVTSYFGDEIWFFEQLGGGQFNAHLKFMYGSINGSGNFTTPPETVTADFDGDGRDELAYLADVNQRIDGKAFHFWETSSSISQIKRNWWDGGDGGVITQWTRSLDAGDFDGDGVPDLAFTGSVNPPFEDDPVLVVWHAFDPITKRFAIDNYYPDFLCSDVATMPALEAGCADNLIIADLEQGKHVQEWWNDCKAPLQFAVDDSLPQLNGASNDRGVALAIADLNNDGTLDIVARHRVGDPANARQIQFLVRDPNSLEFVRISPSPLDTSGLENTASDPQLRPRNLVVADLFGSRLPEVIAAFNPVIVAGQPHGDLRLAVWNNGCAADIDRDGVVGLSDLALMLQAFGCPGDPVDADLTRDGCVDLDDLTILLSSFDCESTNPGDPEQPGGTVESAPGRYGP